MVETAGEVSQQPRRGLDVLTLIGALEDRQYSGPLTLRQMVEDVAGLVDLAARHQRGTTEHHGLRWRAQLSAARRCSTNASRFDQRRSRPAQCKSKASIDNNLKTLEP